MVDRRSPARLEFLSAEGGVPLAVSDSVTVWRVRWNVVAGLGAEGLLVRPRNRTPIAQVIALPDADVTPQQLVGVEPGVRPEDRFALRLAESGCQVIVPALVDRGSRFSGNPALETGRPAMTNMPHREWLYRMAYPMGRHPIGYEVQKVLALVDWLESTAPPGIGIGVAGHGEGGLIALYAAAVDPRIDSCLVSGYFSARERIWREPIYRNVWALLTEFGDAEIGSLVLPRTLVIEHSQAPRVEGPPPAGEGRKPVAAPGRIETPPAEWVISEFERLKRWAEALPAGAGDRVKLVPRTRVRVRSPRGRRRRCRDCWNLWRRVRWLRQIRLRSRSAPGRLPTRSGSSGAWCATSKGRCRTSCESRTESGTNAIWSEPAGSRPSPSPENRPAGAPPSGRSSWARSRTP